MMDDRIVADLERLKKRLLRMASLAEHAVHQSVTALEEPDEALAKRVVKEDETINEMQLQIDEEVYRLLASHRLTDEDLRFTLAVTRINSNLERIGDQAVNIAEAVLRIFGYPRVMPHVDLPRMSTIAGEMVRDSLDAFVNGDEALAASVVSRDDEVDALRDQIYSDLLDYIVSHPSMIFPAFELILVTKDLERIGDQATNIAEEIIYVVTGRDVRHCNAD